MFAMIAALALAAEPAAKPVVLDAYPNVELMAGSQLNFRTQGTKILMTGDSATALSPGQNAALAATREDPNAMGANSKEIVTRDGTPPQPGQLNFSLVANGGDMILTVSNGLPRGVAYKALLKRGDKSQVTDVCQVISGRNGHELWPYRFDSIVISNIRLVDIAPGTRPTCE